MHAITTLAEQYGVSFIFLNVLLDQIGLPVPALPTLIVVGALVADGRLSGFAVLGAAVVACAIADTVWYLAGWRYGNKVMKTLCRISLSPDSCVRQTEGQFERWGASLLVFAKFLPLVAMIAPPLAGAMRVGWPTFLLLSILAAILWGTAGIGAGLLFHAQIEYILAGLQDMGRWSLILIGLLLAGYILIKDLQRRRFFKMLRMARITVDELQALIQAGAKPTIIDVRSPGARARDGRQIPGAVLVNMAELDNRVPELPTDRDIVLYCTCPNEASAARVAKSLMTRGFTRVRPLLGGFDAWVEAGLSVENLPAVGTAQETDSRACIDNVP
jgi:membrane protein DedA with SNARE-associated domain/rhodanese-related sulfurtransferase